MLLCIVSISFLFISGHIMVTIHLKEKLEKLQIQVDKQNMDISQKIYVLKTDLQSLGHTTFEKVNIVSTDLGNDQNSRNKKWIDQ